MTVFGDGDFGHDGGAPMDGPVPLEKGAKQLFLPVRSQQSATPSRAPPEPQRARVLISDFQSADGEEHSFVIREAPSLQYFLEQAELRWWSWHK